MASCFTGVHVVNCKVSRVYFSVVVLCTFEQLEDSTDLFFPEREKEGNRLHKIFIAYHLNLPQCQVFY